MNTYSIVKGTLFHRRFVPKIRTFKNNQILFLMDLDSLINNVPVPWPIKYNGKGILSLHDSSYLDSSNHSLSEKVKSYFQTECSSCSNEHRHFLLASPNVFGYCFNPASFYFRLHLNDDICSAIVEVNNTFGESHLYGLNSSNEPCQSIKGKHQKDFHVSPYISREGTYEFDFTVNDPIVELKISLTQEETKIIETFYKATTTQMTTKTLLFGLWPLFVSVFATELRILIQAFHLQYRKKIAFHKKPQPLKGTRPSPKPGFISKLKIPFL